MVAGIDSTVFVLFFNHEKHPATSYRINIFFQLSLLVTQ